MRRSRSPLKASSILRKKRRKLFFRIFLVVFVLVGGIALATYLSRLEAFAITDIEVQGNLSVAQTELTAVAQEYITGRYVMLFPKRNAFLYPRQQIRADIVNAYPVFKEVRVYLKGLHILILEVKERTPTALWCASGGSGEHITVRQECYFMDDAGFVFSKSPTSSGEVYTRYYGILPGEETVGKTYVIDPGIPAMASFVKQIDDTYQFKTTGIFARGNGEYEARLENNGIIIFGNRQGIDTTLSNLKTVIEGSSLKSVHDMRFEYIDLRFGNKVFYKVRPSALEAVFESTDASSV